MKIPHGSDVFICEVSLWQSAHLLSQKGRRGDQEVEEERVVRCLLIQGLKKLGTQPGS